jgi:hypothetical protein
LIRSLFRLGGAVLAGLLTIGAFVVPASAVAAGNIAGVYTSHSGEPIADAWVAAWRAEDGSYLSGSLTDTAGRYSLAGVPAGPVKLSFQTESLIQWAPRLLDQAKAQVLQVPPDATLSVDEQRRPTGVLTGVVTGAAGAPAPWLTVDAHELAGGTHANAYTDEAGRYTMTVWAGDHHVGFGPDSAKQWAPQAVSKDKARTVTVAAGAPIQLDERLLPTGSIQGRLTAVDGRPLARVDVLLYSGDRQIISGTTDANGAYTFTALPGDYVVSFRSEPNGSEQYIPGGVDRAKAKTHTVAAGQTVVADDAVLKPAVVSGRLTAPDGSAKAKFKVFVMSTDDKHGYGATTGADGTWRVEGVHPGDYRVSFTNQSGGRVQWSPGRTAAPDATVVTVAGGATVTVDDRWLPGATLVVKATDEAAGAPVAEFCAEVQAGSSFTEGCTKTGEVTLTDVAPGAAGIDVVPAKTTFFLQKDGSPVTLAAGQTATVTVPLAKGGKVTVSSVDSTTGAAVGRTCFVLRQIGRGGLPDDPGVCTNAKGRSTGPTLAPGTYEAFALAPSPYGHQWVGATGGTGDQQAAAQIVVEADKTVAAPAARLDRSGILTGVVTGADGKPVQDADVTFHAWNFGPGPVHNVKTDKQGKYTITKLGPYGWPLLFAADGYPRQWSGNDGNRFKAEQVTVTSGATVTYNHALTRASSLQGKVTVPAGLPAGGWRVTAVNAVTGDEMAEFDSYGLQPGAAYTVPVIGDQQVKLRWVAAADGSVVKSGWYDRGADQNAAKSVTVPATGVKRLDLTLG